MLIKITNILVQEGKRRHRRDCSVKTGTEIGVMDPKEPLEQQKWEEARMNFLLELSEGVKSC